jgi:predicted MFS family arabinose efflux permease
MTVNQSAFSLASAVGGSLGGLLLAFGGYALVGAVVPLFGGAAALLVWLSRPRPRVAADAGRRAEQPG